jgi:flavin-dependent dehydrogenase
MDSSRDTVIVHGLGPAGATLAWQLASRGINVAGFDPVRRYVKACGDATPARAMSGMLAEYFNTVIDEVRDFRILVDGVEVAQASTTRKPLWLIIDKSGFVSSLREAAEAEGASLSYHARPAGATGPHAIIIDARGPYSSNGTNDNILVYRVIARAQWPKSTALIDFRTREMGLYWIFPAGDGRVNAGLGFASIKPSIAEMKDMLGSYLAKKVGSFNVVDSRAAPLSPLKPPHLYDKRIIYVGEAAGLVNALSGEGIRQAVESAIRLAEAIDSCGLHRACSTKRYRTYTRTLMVEAVLSKSIFRALLSASPRRRREALESLPASFWHRFLEGRFGRALLSAALSVKSLLRAAPILARIPITRVSSQS